MLKVTAIRFDFATDLEDETLEKQEQNSICENIIGTVWEADDGEDLVEQVTDATGWCVEGINYTHF